MCSATTLSAAPEGHAQVEPRDLVLPGSQGVHTAAGILQIAQSVQNDPGSPVHVTCAPLSCHAVCGMSVGALCAGSGQGGEGSPLSLGTCSALSSVREGPLLFFSPLDSPSRGDCSPHLSFSLGQDLPSTVQWGFTAQDYNERFEWDFRAHLLCWGGLAPTNNEALEADSL